MSKSKPDPAAQSLGARGGAARAKGMSKAERSAASSAAAKARWAGMTETQRSKALAKVRKAGLPKLQN